VYTNVSELVDPPRIHHRAMRALNFDETARFLQAAHGDPLEALYILAIGTGMRRGELLALHWHDISLTGYYLAVNWTLSRTRGSGLVCEEPKTKKSRRRVDLEPGCTDALRVHGRAQKEARLRSGELWHDTDLVFANELGRPVEPSNMLTRSFWPIRQRAGFPELRFHDLRHTAATLMLEAGVDLKRVSDRLGHSTINITADRYLHVTPAMDRSAADAVGHLLRTAQALLVSP
jgi:integrase